MPFKLNPITGKLDYYPKLDDCSDPDDNTDLDASTSKHGLLLKLDDDTGKWLRSDGAWQAIPELDTLTDNSMADTLHRHSELSASDETPDQALIVDAAGNVGIGTTSPDSIFHIKANTPGTVGSHAAGQLIIQDPDDTVFGNAVITGYESDGAGNPDQQLWYLGSSSVNNTDIIFLNRRNANLHLGTNGVSRLTISGNGNVGIGEAVPAAKLDVNGDLILQNGTSINEFSTDDTLAGDSDDAVPTEQTVKAHVGVITTGIISRAHFTYNGAATAYTVKLNGGRYWCKDKFCFWDSELTTAAIGTPAASTDYYLYLDYSAITSFTAITATELIWSTTVPTYNPVYGMHMNGDDVCIFGTKTNATPNNILEFFHSGDFIVYGNRITEFDNVDVDMVWMDATLSIPAFACRALVSFLFYQSTGVASTHYYWRTNDQTGANGHGAGWSSSVVIAGYNTLEVITDSSQIIEVKLLVSDTHVLSIITDGWFFPDGM